jgi:hypothetical protein
VRPETVFTKTPQGLEELESRALGLGPMTRRLLIQVDGRRTVDQLIHDNAGSMDVSAELERLRSRGLIAEPGQAGPKPETPPPGTGESMREALIAMCATVLGDQHATRIATKLEGIPANDAEQLGQVVDSCVRLIRLTIDEDKGEMFRRQAEVILRQPR